MNTGDTLEMLVDNHLLTEEQAALTLETQASYGGSLLRTIERIFTPEEVEGLWKHMAQQMERTYLRTPAQIETLEQPIQEDGKWKPLIPRTVACNHLLLGHRTEWDILSVISVNPFVDITAPILWERAAQVSPTGKGRVRACVIGPNLFRKCFKYAYPKGLYPSPTLIEMLAVQGLCPLMSLTSYAETEIEAVKSGLICEDDFALCLSQFLNLPLYNYTTPEIDWRILPENLITRLGILPLRLHEGRVEVLTPFAPKAELTQELRRQSGRDISYLITTPSIITMLRRQRELYVKT